MNTLMHYFPAGATPAKAASAHTHAPTDAAAAAAGGTPDDVRAESTPASMPFIDLATAAAAGKHARQEETPDDDEDSASQASESSGLAAPRKLKRALVRGSAGLREAAAKPKRAAAAAKKPKGPTLEQERRRIGDAVKAQICVEKYTCAPRCHTVFPLDVDVFTALVVPNCERVTPAAYDASTPVVVADVVGEEAAGEIFGKTKIKGSNRMQTWVTTRMQVVYFPGEGKAHVWWTMV